MECVLVGSQAMGGYSGKVVSLCSLVLFFFFFPPSAPGREPLCEYANFL